MQVSPGVFIETNEHYDRAGETHLLPELIEVLSQSWDEAQRFAQATADAVISSSRT